MGMLTLGCYQSQQLQMAPISSPDVHPGQVETQEMRVLAPAGVSDHPVRLHALSLTFSCRQTSGYDYG